MSTSGAAGSGLVTVHTHLTGAQVATLFSSPVLVAAAPGAGKALWVSEVYAEFAQGLVTYESTAPALYYGGGVPAAAAKATDPVLGVIDPFAANASSVFPGITNLSLTLRTIVENKGLYAACTTADPTRVGPLVAATVVAGGAGYVVNDTGTLDSNLYGAAATYRVSAVGGGGAVTAFVITAAGDGNALGSTNNTTTNAGAQPGVGAGFTFTVTNVSPADGDLYVTTIYATVPLH